MNTKAATWCAKQSEVALGSARGIHHGCGSLGSAHRPRAPFRFDRFVEDTLDMINRAVFLDRDGVLSRSGVRAGKPYAPTRIEDFEILHEAYGATEALRCLGFYLVVVTNQPDVGNCKILQSTVEQMNQLLERELSLEKICVCFHGQSAGCGCRKPKPGMLLEAATEFGIDLNASFMVGDRWSDIEAGKAAGCRTVFIDRQYDERQPSSPDYTVTSLTEAADVIRDAVNAPGHPR